MVTAGIMRILGPGLAGLILLAGVIGALYRWGDRKLQKPRRQKKTPAGSGSAGAG